MQVGALSSTVDMKGLEALYLLGAGTVPKRNTTLDWSYGDRSEMFAVSFFISQQLRDYCLNRIGSLYSSRVGDTACADSIWPYPQGYANYYTQFEMALQLLGQYGISGDLTVPSVNIFGGEILVSLLREDPLQEGSSVRYCSPLPPSKADTEPSGQAFAQLIDQTHAQCIAGTRRSKFQVGDQRLGGSGPVSDEKNYLRDVDQVRGVHSMHTFV